MNHYLYRHIRLDKNEPFYIGIATKKNQEYLSYESEYSRAFSKQRRDSKIWKAIVKRTNYRVEILFESKNYLEIKEKEKEFIKLYGRIDKKTGILANMTDGGDGTLGLIVSEETRKKLRQANIERVCDYGTKIYQYNLKGNFIREWINITQAAKSINTCKSNLSKIIKTNSNGNFCKGFYWTNFLSDKIECKKYRDDFRGNILMIDPLTNKIHKTFKTKRKAVSFIGLRPKNQTPLRKAIRDEIIYYNYKWKEERV